MILRLFPLSFHCADCRKFQTTDTFNKFTRRCVRTCTDNLWYDSQDVCLKTNYNDPVRYPPKYHENIMIEDYCLPIDNIDNLNFAEWWQNQYNTVLDMNLKKITTLKHNIDKYELLLRTNLKLKINDILAKQKKHVHEFPLNAPLRLLKFAKQITKYIKLYKDVNEYINIDHNTQKQCVCCNNTFYAPILSNDNYVKCYQMGQMVQTVNENNIICHLCLLNVTQKCNTSVSKQIKKIVSQIAKQQAKWIIAWFDLRCECWRFGNIKKITPQGKCTVTVHDSDIYDAGSNINIYLSEMMPNSFIVCYKQQHQLQNSLKWIKCDDTAGTIQDWLGASNAFTAEWEIPIKTAQGYTTIVLFGDVCNNVSLYNAILTSV